jgi:hypothetical protein
MLAARASRERKSVIGPLSRREWFGCIETVGPSLDDVVIDHAPGVDIGECL